MTQSMIAGPRVNHSAKVPDVVGGFGCFCIYRVKNGERSREALLMLRCCTTLLMYKAEFSLREELDKQERNIAPVPSPYISWLSTILGSSRTEFLINSSLTLVEELFVSLLLR
jgi:hypothetical protein